MTLEGGPEGSPFFCAVAVGCLRIRNDDFCPILEFRVTFRVMFRVTF
jgi:hypothetical protein